MSSCLRVINRLLFRSALEMDFLVPILLNVVLPAFVILASFGLVFTYAFKTRVEEPDFTGFNEDEEEEKTKTKKNKPKKNVGFLN